LIVALTEVMRTIEQNRFSAEVNLAAGTKAFRRGLRNHPLVHKLAEFAKDPQSRREIAERISTLSRAQIDERYENSFDAALSAYLTVLGDTAEPDSIAEAASAVASAQNCWWAVGISRELLMRTAATGHLQSTPVAYLDANLLVSKREWKTTLADEFRDWFSERWFDSSAEKRSWVLHVLRYAQSTGQYAEPVPTQQENDEPVVPLNVRRLKKGMRRHHVHRATPARHRPWIART
jgi:hypothetical protein